MAESLPSIKLSTYEGPFDLLLELAQARKLDLTTVSLKEMTEAFLEYLKTNLIRPQLLGDFLVVASSLLLLKVRHLLPRQEASEPEVEQLTDRLRIYRLYREQAEKIRQGWGQCILISRGVFAPQACLPAVNADDLAKHVQHIIARLPKPPQPALYTPARGRTLQECLRVFQERLTQASRLIFQKEVASANRHTAAVSFLAVLELARQQHVALQQETMCGELVISRPL